MSNSVPLKGEADKEIGANFAPLSVTAQDIPNLTVRIRAGSFWNADDEVVEFPGGNSPSIPAPGSLNRWTLVSLSSSASVVLTHGTTAAAPSIPAPPTGNLPLAAVYMSSSTTQITSGLINDVRPLNRVVADPTAALVNYPTFTDMNNALALKADVDGTPNSQFYMNKGAAGPANALFSVDRGASLDVSIRWNEATDTWQFTNDGIGFVDIAAVAGSFIPLVGGATVGNVPTLTAGGALIDSGTPLTGLATDAEVAAAIATKLDDFVGVNGNVVTVAGAGTALADGGIALSALATDAELAAGLALKANLTGATFTGTVTVDNGVDQPISLVQFDPASSGLQVDRGGPPNAILEWDESTDQWLVGVVGSAFPILTSENLALTDLTDVTITAPVANNVLQYNGALWVNRATIALAAGTALLPAYTFVSDATKGMYDSGAGEVSFAIAGAQKVRIDAGGITTFSGYASTPGMALWSTADPTTGVSFGPPGVMTMMVAGAPVATFGGPPGPMTALTAASIGVTVQAWDADLDAVAALATTGLVARTGAGTVATRTLTSTGGTITVTNGNGVAANPNVDLPATGVITASYGDAANIATFSVDLQGRLTTAASVAVAITSSQVTDFAEAAQDAVGTTLTDTASVELVYTDGPATIEANVLPAGVDHDALMNFVANEHVDHSGVGLTAGVGLTGGGDITTSRTFNVAAFKGTQSVTFGAIVDGAVGDSTNTITVTGAVVGDPVVLGLPSTVPAGFTYNGYVSGANTITVRAANNGGGTGAGAADATINAIVLTYSEF